MSLKDDLRKRILEDLIAGCKKGGDDEYMVLVLDPHTSKIVSSACRMFDIMDAGILAVENITRKREKLDMAAIYFITPTPENVARIQKDFENELKPQYSAIHLFFTTRLDKLSMNELANTNAVARIATLKELNCDFVAMESRVYSFNREQFIPTLYFNGMDTNSREELSFMSRQLASLCLTTNEFPHIRYDRSSRRCKALAQFVETDLKNILKMLPKWELDNDRERGTLLIVDRQMDPLSPLMHEVTYQAMLQDALQINGELVEVEDKDDEKNAKTRTVVISEDDELWTQWRHDHIAKVSSEITQKFKEFKESSAIVNMKGSQSSVKELRSALSEAPQYKAMMDGFVKHMDFVQMLMDQLTGPVKGVADLEQDMATGIDSDGDSVKASNVTSKLKALISDSTVSRMDKLRLLMIYTITQGSLGNSLHELLRTANINPRMQDAILNLRFLGVDVHAKTKPKLSKDKQKLFQERYKNMTLMLERYQPDLEIIMEEMVADTLDRDAYPYTQEPPPKAATSGRKFGNSSRRRKKGYRKTEEKTDSARFIVFVVGGVTFSEIRSAYEVSKSKGANVNIGAADLLTPRKYIGQLAKLKPTDDVDKVVSGLGGNDSDSDDDY